jgi:predicted negative regulator of RcsB-dependent stress response
MNNNNSNLILAITLALGIMFGWQYFYEKPRLDALTQEHKQYNNQMAEIKDSSASGFNGFGRKECCCLKIKKSDNFHS